MVCVVARRDTGVKQRKVRNCERGVSQLSLQIRAVLLMPAAPCPCSSLLLPPTSSSRLPPPTPASPCLLPPSPSSSHPSSLLPPPSPPSYLLPLQVWGVAFSSTGSHLASVGDDKRLVVYAVA